MPDRIVRDELLTSERYWSVSIQAQQLYVHILLVVDDAARFSGKNFTLRAACLPGRPIEAAAMERMLTELVDADLVRLYDVGGERYVFVPRFRNRRRYIASSKYPAPPIEINDLLTDKSSSGRPQVIPKAAPSQEGLGLGLGLGRGKEKIPRKRGPASPELTIEALCMDGLPEDLANEWLAHRRRKRAVLTPRAWDQVKSEIDKAGWTREDAIAKALGRGWVGIEADWLLKEKTTQASADNSPEWVRERDEKVFKMTGGRMGKSTAKPKEVIDADAKRLD